MKNGSTKFFYRDLFAMLGREVGIFVHKTHDASVQRLRTCSTLHLNGLVFFGLEAIRRAPWVIVQVYV